MDRKGAEDHGMLIGRGGERNVEYYSEVVDSQCRDGGHVSGQLGDVAQLLQVPQDAGEVTGAAHYHAVGLRHSQARHGSYVTVQRLQTRAIINTNIIHMEIRLSNTHADTRTCLSFMCKSLPLLTATSHTHTTVLVPAVTTVVGLGEAAHNVSPQSHKLSHTAKVCG